MFSKWQNAVLSEKYMQNLWTDVASGEVHIKNAPATVSTHDQNQAGKIKNRCQQRQRIGGNSSNPAPPCNQCNVLSDFMWFKKQCESLPDQTGVSCRSSLGFSAQSPMHASPVNHIYNHQPILQEDCSSQLALHTHSTQPLQYCELASRFTDIIKLVLYVAEG